MAQQNSPAVQSLITAYEDIAAQLARYNGPHADHKHKKALLEELASIEERLAAFGHSMDNVNDDPKNFVDLL